MRLVCAEIMLQFSRRNALHLVSELLSIYHSNEISFRSFQESIKTQRKCAKQASNQSNGDLMSPGCTEETLDM